MFLFLIQIPSPTAAGDHQTKNAYIMADLAGSKVLTEEDLDSNLLEDTINEVLGMWALALMKAFNILWLETRDSFLIFNDFSENVFCLEVAGTEWL